MLGLKIRGVAIVGKTHMITDEGRGVSDVFASDLDNDGDLDVLSAHYNYGVIAWCENLGKGIFGPRQTITDKAKGANSVHSADLDNDGDQDVLSAAEC